MYVVTFYSFKGGVGRTMALVNVAAELAKNGRRILMVDFDLEAPGLFDFGLLEKKETTPGLVEFICDYTESGKVPDVTKYMYQSTKFKETGDRLWLMPAGCQNGDYQSLFSSINWQELYEKKNGYFLLEDLRAQWEKTLKPDYVFIDSRTGYTDIAGICTRQLPDAVCMLFTPNRQNLTGLSKITAEIKAQSAVPELRRARRLYVASNIPSLDDDEQLLAKALGNFSKKLEYAKPSAIIHHHSSFALINEAVFTIEYPNNQLSLEYKGLAEEITRDNFGDKYTALNFLKSIVHGVVVLEDHLSAQETETKLIELETLYPNDAEVLFWLSRARRVSGNFEESELLLDSAIDKGLNSPRGYLDRAIIKINNPEPDGDVIWNDLLKVLSWKDKIHPSEVLWAIKLAIRIGHRSVEEYLDATAISSLKNGDLIYLVQKLRTNEFGARLGVCLLSKALTEKVLDAKHRDMALEELGLGSIALGDLKAAVNLLSRETRVKSETLPANTAFNIGMAKYWGKENDSLAYFNRVLELVGNDKEISTANANHLQCISFAFFVTGDRNNAFRILQLAKDKTLEEPRPNLSCWRYLEVAPSKFKEDLDDMERLYQGKDMKPLFFRQAFPID